MPDAKITALTSIGTSTDPANDPLVLVDVSDTSMAASGTTKKVTLNQLLATSPTATLASATITGDLTVDTSTLKVDSANNRVGLLTASPESQLDVRGLVAVRGTPTFPTTGVGLELFYSSTNSNSNLYSYDRGGAAWAAMAYGASSHTFQLSGVNAMTLNSTGLGVGTTPDNRLVVSTAAANDGIVLKQGSITVARFGIVNPGVSNVPYIGTVANNDFYFITNNVERMRLDTSGNVGIGVTPSAWGAGYKALQLGNGLSLMGSPLNGTIAGNAWFDGTNWKYITANPATLYYASFGANGSHVWSISSGVPSAGGNVSLTNAMTLDASGNLLVGITSGSYNRIKKDVTADAGNAIFELVGASNATSSIHYSVSSYNANAANAASKFGRDGVTLRSINAGGTVNASGADYAEYMTKAGGFVLSKGDVAGIDANGKLTNVFADAVSFVVKSTDPSYVGNDKWGNDLEGDELEAARQLVDRIAFAGQVPVNVIGAKSGDYIVPVVDGTGIKGIAVSNPTFEQYQLAVGKVIAIDSDGRARIIVKVA